MFSHRSLWEDSSQQKGENTTQWDRELRAEGGGGLDSSRDGVEVSTGHSQQAPCLSSACLASPTSILLILFLFVLGLEPRTSSKPDKGSGTECSRPCTGPSMPHTERQGEPVNREELS